MLDIVFSKLPVPLRSRLGCSGNNIPGWRDGFKGLGVYSLWSRGFELSHSSRNEGGERKRTRHHTIDSFQIYDANLDLTLQTHPSPSRFSFPQVDHLQYFISMSLCCEFQHTSDTTHLHSTSRNVHFYGFHARYL